MSSKATLALMFSVLVCAAPPVAAQGGRGGGGGGPGSQYGRMYNPQTVTTVGGEIAKVDKIVPVRGMHRGVHLLLKTSEPEPLAVHLGPEWFVDRQEITFKPGDKVEVRGSRITFDGKPAIIAADVTKDGKTLHLRDANGVPVWAGWRGRGR
jgi:hypothetical protein